MDIIYQASNGSIFRATYTPINFKFRQVKVYVCYSLDSELYEGPHDPWQVSIQEALRDKNLVIKTRCTALLKRVANVVY